MNPYIFCFFACVILGVKQASDPEGLGTRHASPAPRVKARIRAPPSQHHSEDKERADSPATPDRAHQSAGVQQEEGEGTSTQTCHGGSPATQKPQG